MNDRGQTLYDFLLGATLFMVSIIIVLSLFDPLFGAFTNPVSGAEQEMADRIADDIIEEQRAEFGDNYVMINSTALVASYLDDRKDSAGVPEIYSVNVTVEDNRGNIIEDEDGPLAVGDPRTNEPVALTRRMISFPPGVTDSSNDPVCRPGCYLRVEVS